MADLKRSAKEFMRQLILVLLMCAAAGCGTMKLDPTWIDDRPVQPASDATKIVTVPEGMVFYDANPATRGIRFPAGTYVLEAEDADYWYFRSPAPLELRTLSAQKVTDGRDIIGGLMVAKHFSMVPGAGYIDSDGGKKMAVWKLGGEWLRLQGKYWTKSF